MSVTVNLNFTEAIELKAADRQACLADIKSLGVSTIRCEFPWLLVAKSWAQADALMTDIGNAGLHVLGLVAHPPSSLFSSKPSASSFGTMMGKLATRYKQIPAWEIWNEPNLHEFWSKGNPTTFTPYLQAGYRAVKAASSANTVVFAGLAACATDSGWAVIPKFPFLASYTNTDPAAFLTGAYKAGAKGYFDVLGYHPYCVDEGFRHQPFNPANEYIAKLATLVQVMADNADIKPIRCTEYGYSTDDFTTTDQQTYLAAETAYLRGLPGNIIDQVFVYCYRDNNGEAYGLKQAGGAAKPAYTWFSGVAKQ